MEVKKHEAPDAMAGRSIEWQAGKKYENEMQRKARKCCSH